MDEITTRGFRKVAGYPEPQIFDMNLRAPPMYLPALESEPTSYEYFVTQGAPLPPPSPPPPSPCRRRLTTVHSAMGILGFDTRRQERDESPSSPSLTSCRSMILWTDATEQYMAPREVYYSHRTSTPTPCIPYWSGVLLGSSQNMKDEYPLREMCGDTLPTPIPMWPCQCDEERLFGCGFPQPQESEIHLRPIYDSRTQHYSSCDTGDGFHAEFLHKKFPLRKPYLTSPMQLPQEAQLLEAGDNIYFLEDVSSHEQQSSCPMRIQTPDLLKLRGKKPCGEVPEDQSLLS